MIKLSTRVIHNHAKPVGLAQKYAPYLTRLLPSTLASEPVCRIARRRCLVVWGVLCVMAFTPVLPAQAMTISVDYLKLYAHSRIVNYKQFQCFNKLITQESRWSYLARNGSHYGLGQMRSTHYRDLDAFRQIDASLLYIGKRYKTPCSAWSYHQKHGWY